MLLCFFDDFEEGLNYEVQSDDRSEVDDHMPEPSSSTRPHDFDDETIRPERNVRPRIGSELEESRVVIRVKKRNIMHLT